MQFIRIQYSQFLNFIFYKKDAHTSDEQQSQVSEYENSSDAGKKIYKREKFSNFNEQ